MVEGCAFRVSCVVGFAATFKCFTVDNFKLNVSVAEHDPYDDGSRAMVNADRSCRSKEMLERTQSVHISTGGLRGDTTGYVYERPCVVWVTHVAY